MWIDGRSIPNGSELATDLCIVGAGAAGITLARSLAGQSLQISLIESGGLEPDADTQSLAAGEVGGIGYVPLESARLRYFGGTTGHWAGWCRPFEAIDFEQRAWVPHSGWPITRAHLDPYYPQAQQICELGAFDYDPLAWNLSRTPTLPLAGEEVMTRLIQFSTPTRFGVRYRSALLASGNIKLFLYSNVVRIEPSANGSQIQRLHIATLSGIRYSIKAKMFVLAAGGIENARLLLASNQILNAGVGNANDVVGRYFADHIQLDTAGIFPLRAETSFELYLGENRERNWHPVRSSAPAALMGYLALRPDVQRRARTLNYSAKIVRTWLSDYYLQVRRQELSSSSAFTRMTDRMRTVFDSIADAASIAGDRVMGKERTFYKLVTTQEQAPNPDSRVVLGTALDRLGMPVARLLWELTELDRYTIKTAIAKLVQAFGASGIARLRVPLDLDHSSWLSNIGCSWHHCGTTRMHADPKQGVVDANCRVHGVSNLHVIGSSVFTTNGHGNPTLTIVALSLRLADHLQKVLA